MDASGHNVEDACGARRCDAPSLDSVNYMFPKRRASVMGGIPAQLRRP